jgi:hypothetical protein
MMPKWVIALDEYERSNLLWLLRIIGFPNKSEDKTEPFNYANTGDWIGQIAWKLRYEDGAEHEPNVNMTVFRQKIIDWVANTTSDKLKMMWDQQENFMRLLQEKRNFPQFPVDISTKKGQQFLEGISFHLMKELFEAGQHLKNSKAHRATELPEVDREAYKEELVDVLHLFFELVIGSGITLSELFDAYMHKGNVNVDRINAGY